MTQNAFKISEQIQWKWLGRWISGTVTEVHLASITKLIKGKRITRHGTAEKPAYVVKSEAGNIALKLHSELEPVGLSKLNKKTKSKLKGKTTPRMFG